MMIDMILEDVMSNAKPNVCTLFFFVKFLSLAARFTR